MPSLQITPPDQPIVLKPPVMVCDKPIAAHIPAPLPNTAHYLVSAGPPRSGKTSALMSLLTQKNPRIYLKAFHNIMVIMPASSRKSLKEDPFATLDEEKVFDELSPSVLEQVGAMAKERMEKGEQSLLFVDDMAASLKNNDCLKAWNTLINNRRHLRLSIWCIVQTYKSIPLANRRTITHMLLFKPNNRKEGEAITQELVMMPPYEWDIYVNHAFGQGVPHSFLFLDVDAQAVYDREFNRLEMPGSDVVNVLEMPSRGRQPMPPPEPSTPPVDTDGDKK